MSGVTIGAGAQNKAAVSITVGTAAGNRTVSAAFVGTSAGVNRQVYAAAGSGGGGGGGGPLDASVSSPLGWQLAQVIPQTIWEAELGCNVSGGSGGYSFSWSIIAGSADFSGPTNEVLARIRAVQGSSPAGTVTVRCSVSDGATTLHPEATPN